MFGKSSGTTGSEINLALPNWSEDTLNEAQPGHGDDPTFIRLNGQDEYAPTESYEGRHRYDPTYTWSASSEKKLVRKLDLRLCTWVSLVFFALQFDRGNLQQALADNFLHDLGLTRDDYNNGQMIFFLCIMAGGLPNQLIAKRVGPERWIAFQLTVWSFVAALQSLLGGRSSFFATRAILGFFEGGFHAEIVLYLSSWYTSRELAVRLWCFFSSYTAASIVGAFLAAGLLSLRGVDGLEGWRWLFAIEGSLAAVAGLLTFLYLPSGPCQTKPSTTWLRLCGRNGWFTVEEEKILVNRVLRDDPSKGDMHNRQPITLSLLWQALRDWEMWPLYLLALSTQIPTIPCTQYLSLLLTQYFSRFKVSMLMIPSYVIWIINLFWLVQLAERTKQRMFAGMLSQIYCLGPLLALELLPGGHTVSRWSRYVPLILIVGAPYVHAPLLSLTSRNAGSVRTRAVSVAILDIALQASNTIGTQIYRAHDAPLYRTGNNVLLAITAYNIVLFVVCREFYRWRNRVRESKWSAMSKDEKTSYLHQYVISNTASTTTSRTSSVSTVGTKIWAEEPGRSGKVEADNHNGNGQGNKLLTFRFGY